MVMSNTWFQFKQFTISQDRCAMKVTTDACIQGAWTPIAATTERILDIGAGTGLLSLMMAQRCTCATIEAVEYDAEAVRQAMENFAASPWKDRLGVTNCDVKDFHPPHPYDLIICNPPFFSNSLLSGKENKDKARHDISLTRTELAQIAARHLAENGQFSILLPYPEYQLWKEAATLAGLFETSSLHVRHTPTATVKRVVGMFGKASAAGNLAIEELVIKGVDGDYTDDFKKLLSPFYLQL